ncbi:hypothetical protein [Motilibacter deserti]|uniref:Integral membrane protein n=1 Tax=Motilibacter deserti TaxID=2714956 RepID=A0ABX0GU57_9ACTN|nr:hypothetical protein [Motilibacter deserti]NHC14080.1 hypothetical protein [Motilibacter deserti]
MNTLRLLLLVVHILGLSVLIGPFLFQVSRKAGFDTRLMLVGAATQLVSGVALVGVRQADDLEVNNAKIAVKLVVALLAFVSVVLAARKQRAADAGAADAKAPLPFFHSAGAFAIANVLVAVLWT